MTDSQSQIANRQLHVAIIPDGNRRLAKAKGLHPSDGHKEAIEHFRSLTEWCRKDPHVSALTVWCFSTENWKRDKKEVEMLMSMLEEYLKRERKGFLDEKTRFVHSGRKDRIPKSLAKLIADVEEETKDQKEFTLHLAVDYGGMDEVARAAGKIQGNVTPESIRENVDHPELPDIDLVIRTSGETRTSNFFLWQAAFAECDFLDCYFPDFGIKELSASVEKFAKRSRRFGS